jgi:hypothetical protein
MASTYSANLKIELIGTGEQAGTWGTTTNSNLGSATRYLRALNRRLVEKPTLRCRAPRSRLRFLTPTLPRTHGPIYLNLTGSPGGAAVLEVPAVQKPYIVKNGSDQQVTIKVSGQTGVPIPTAQNGAGLQQRHRCRHSCGPHSFFNARRSSPNSIWRHRHNIFWYRRSDILRHPIVG